MRKDWSATSQIQKDDLNARRKLWILLPVFVTFTQIYLVFPLLQVFVRLKYNVQQIKSWDHLRVTTKNCNELKIQQKSLCVRGWKCWKCAHIKRTWPGEDKKSPIFAFVSINQKKKWNQKKFKQRKAERRTRKETERTAPQFKQQQQQHTRKEGSHQPTSEAEGDFQMHCQATPENTRWRWWDQPWEEPSGSSSRSR